MVLENVSMNISQELAHFSLGFMAGEITAISLFFYALMLIGIVSIFITFLTPTIKMFGERFRDWIKKGR